MRRHLESVVYSAILTIYVVENGYIVKAGNPESIISKQWVAETKEALVEAVCDIADKFQPKDPK